MDEVKLKIEPNAGSEVPLFVNEEVATNPNQGLTIHNAPLWKRENGTLLQRVEIKEQSLTIAIPQILDLKAKLLKYAEDIPSIKKIIDDIDSTLSRNRKCRVTAGAIAATGMGKSTAWNAVLGIPELLPTDNGHACTSAIIEVLYNFSDDPAATFRANIIFLEKSEWQAELEQLYEDIEALARKESGDDDNDDGIDVDLSTRIDSAMEKVRVVYPRIKTRQDLKQYTPAKLMTDPSVQNLGLTLPISSDNLHKFTAQIRRFIVSSSSGEKSAPWPLVKVAEIFVKSPILKDGLVLVDIPGNMDTNLARNSLAQSYQRKLSVTCILTASKRAASDQNAQLTLSQTLERHMQLDGRWKPENVIFIIVRTDESISVDDHLSKNPAVVGNLSHLLSKEKEFVSRKAILSREMQAIKAKSKNQTNHYRDVDKQIRDLFSWFNNIPEIKNLSRAEKRKNMTFQLQQLQRSRRLSPEAMSKAKELDVARVERARTKKTNKEASQQVHANSEKINDLDILLERIACKKLQACIADRTAAQSAKIRDNFRRTSEEIGNICSPEALPVIGISAAKFLDFLKGEPPSLGFPKEQDTHIPHLRKALIATTLEARHRNARTSLEEIEALLSSIQSWASSLASTYQLKHEQKQDLEEMFDENIADMSKAFSKINIETADSVSHTLKSGIHKKLRPFEGKAARTAPGLSETWAVKAIPFGTYRATNKRMGEFQSPRRPDPYSWNEDLSGNYFSAGLKSLWNKTFDTALQPIRAQLGEEVVRILSDFSLILIQSANDICPEIYDSIKSFSESMEQQAVVLQETYMLCWDTKIFSGRTNTHRSVKYQIQVFMTETYEEAAEIKGKNSKKRMAKILRDSLDDTARAMYKRSSHTLVCGLDHMVSELQKELDTTPENLLAHTRKLFAMLLQNHKPIARNPALQKALKETKGKLLKDVTTAIGHLNVCLESNVRIPLEEVEEPPLCYDIDEKVPENPDSDMFFLDDDVDEEVELIMGDGAEDKFGDPMEFS